MSRVLRLGFLGLLATGSVSTAANAQLSFRTKNLLVGKMVAEINTSSSLRTPDELDPAIIPYNDCMTLQAGASIGGASPSTDVGNKDCSALRVDAAKKSDEILAAMGIDDPKDRALIVTLTLGNVDIHSEFLTKTNTLQKQAYDARNQ